MSKVIELTKENFDREVLQSNIPVLVDFWAPWCQPCLMMAPALDELSEELDGRLKIGKLNMELSEHQSLAIQYQIQAIPNMKLFKGGKIIKEFIGLRQKASFKSELEVEL
jgi:thioredoxin 1